MPWLKVDDNFPEHERIIGLSVQEKWRLVEDACAYARGESMFGPSLLEGLVSYRFGRRRRLRWNRLRLWQKFEGRCYLCGEAVTSSEFHVEHVVPLSRGGEDRWNNLNIAHAACNLSKGSRLLEEMGLA